MMMMIVNETNVWPRNQSLQIISIKVLHCMYAKLKLFLNASPSNINLPHTPYLPLFISHSLYPCREKEVHINCESAPKGNKINRCTGISESSARVLPFFKIYEFTFEKIFYFFKWVRWDGMGVVAELLSYPASTTTFNTCVCVLTRE